MRVRLGVLMATMGLAAMPVGASAASLVPLAPADAFPSDPINVVSPAKDPRIFVAQRSGAVRIIENGVLRAAPFVTVPNVDVPTNTERGVGSVAFPPDFATTGKFYVFATIAGTPVQSRVIEYTVSAGDPNVANPDSARVVLRQDLTTATNHNGGQLAFGPDGYLYVTIGDNTRRNEAQNVNSFLGKVLRIDPADPDGAGAQTYTVPASNPFAGNPVWALGLRNPFRASFAPDGRLIIADVGEGGSGAAADKAREEVNIGAPGANYGWPICEGETCTGDPAASATFKKPFHSYRHNAGADRGRSIIGGLVVRDPRLTDLAGRYLYGDFISNDVRTIDLGAGGPGARQETSFGEVGGLFGFGEDARGCTYVISNGAVWRVAVSAGDTALCSLPFLGTTPETPGQTTPPVTTPPITTPPVSTPQPPVTTPQPNVPAPTTPKPAKAISKTCVSAGQISVRSTRGRITAVRLITGKKTKSVKFKRKGDRAELRGLPSTKTVKVRLTVKPKKGRTVQLTKTYRACAA